MTITVSSLENPELIFRMDLRILRNMNPEIRSPVIKDDQGVRIKLGTDEVFYNTRYTFLATLGQDNDLIPAELREYLGTFGDGTGQDSGSEVVHTYALPDAYTVTITVREWSDEERTKLYGEVFYQFLFEAQNAAPGFSVKTSDEGDSYLKGVPVEFQVFDVADEEPGALGYTWAFGDGNISHTDVPLVNRTYTSGGNYRINVQAKDPFGKTSSRELQIIVTSRPPTASFTMRAEGGAEENTRLVIYEGDSVSFDARVSSDPDAGDTIVSYGWSFGDGTNGTGPQPTHIYKKKGEWNVTLTVFDEDGERDATGAWVRVEEGEDDENALLPGPTSPVTVVGASVAGSLLLFLAATELGRYRLFVFLLPLYTRLTKQDVLSDFNRGQIFGSIRTQPGITLNEIRKKLNMPNGTAVYHLDVLERERFIKSARDGFHRRFYPWGMKVAKDVFYPSELQRTIMKTIVASPGSTQVEIAGKLGMKKETLHYHIKKLRRLGIIRMEKEGGNSFCRIEDGYVSQLQGSSDSPQDPKAEPGQPFSPPQETKVERFQANGITLLPSAGDPETSRETQETSGTPGMPGGNGGQATRSCPHCGKVLLTPGALKFCVWCGGRFDR